MRPPLLAVLLLAIAAAPAPVASADATGGPGMEDRVRMAADRPPATRNEAAERLRALDRSVGNPVGGACLTGAEATAETVLRLHTELMQASLACADRYDDPETYRKYREFTARHADILRRSEETLMRYFSGRGDGRFLYDSYRTALANEESGVLNRFATDRYCAIRNSRFHSLIGARPDQFEAYVADVTGRRLASSECR
jgi:hypothetical protein